MRALYVLLACAFAAMLAACGGGKSATTGNVLPVSPPDSHAPDPSSAPRATPRHTASPAPTAAPTPTPAPSSAPARSSARIPSTNGRIGLAQIFDYHNGYLSGSQIAQYGRRFDAVWASLEPSTWANVHPGMLVSEYFIMGLDQLSLTHHALAWWQANHPDWILYACTPNGAPTHDIAYMSGIGVADMPLDIHNTAAVSYQIATMSQAAKRAGYSALAIDQVVFWNIYLGGNPNFGQSTKSSEYGCGVWRGGSFVRRYASKSDPQYVKDVVNYVARARSIAHSYGLTLIVNHPAGSVANTAERALLTNTDVSMDETGFSAYGQYLKHNGDFFRAELPYLRYGQEHGTAMIVVDKFANEAHVDAAGFEYSLATYLLANDGALLLFVGGLDEYGTIQYHSEYGAPIGHACAAVAGGPYVYYRRYSGGLAAVNATAQTRSFTLPAGSYRDIEGRAVRSTLALAPNDAYVLLGSGGCS